MTYLRMIKFVCCHNDDDDQEEMMIMTMWNLEQCDEREIDRLQQADKHSRTEESLNNGLRIPTLNQGKRTVGMGRSVMDNTLD